MGLKVKDPNGEWRSTSGGGGSKPNLPLQFTGAVEAIYDGSKAVTVEIPEGGGGGSKPIQPDWAQDDKTAPDYVKNRTHYEGMVEGGLYHGNASNEDYALYDTYTDYPLLVEGSEYVVTVDGVRYELVAFIDSHTGIAMVGAPAASSEYTPPTQFDFTEYPFSIINFYDEPWALRAVFSDNEVHSLYVARFEFGIKKLDPKYLPDSLVTTEQFEDVKNDVNDMKLTLEGMSITTKIVKTNPADTYEQCLKAYNRGDNMIFVADDVEYEFYKYNGNKFVFRGYDPETMTFTIVNVGQYSIGSTTKTYDDAHINELIDNALGEVESNLLVVTVSSETGDWVSSHTYQEIKAFVEDGGDVALCVEGSITSIFSLATVSDTNAFFGKQAFVGRLFISQGYYINADGTVTLDQQMIEIPEGGESITVDDALSPDSTNPVQNKVIFAYLEEATNVLGQIQGSIPSDDHINGLINTALGDVETALDEINGEVV